MMMCKTMIYQIIQLALVVCKCGYLCAAVVGAQCPQMIYDRLHGYSAGQQGVHFLVVEVTVLGCFEAGGVLAQPGMALL